MRFFSKILRLPTEETQPLLSVVIDGDDTNPSSTVPPEISTKDDVKPRTVPPHLLIKDDVKKNIAELKEKIQLNEEALAIINCSITDIEGLIAKLKKETPNFIKRHPYLSLGYFSFPAGLAAMGYLINVLVKHEQSELTSAVDQYNNTLIPNSINSTMTCGEYSGEHMFSSRRDFCFRSHDNPNYPFIYFCDNLLKELCLTLDTDPTSISLLAVTIIIPFIGMTIAGITLGITKDYRHSFTKDDRLFSSLSTVAQTNIQNIFTAAQIQRVPQNTDKIYEVIEQLNEILSPFQEAKEKFMRDIATYRKELETYHPDLVKIQRLHYIKYRAFFGKNPDDKLKVSIAILPEDVKKKIWSYVDDEESYRKTYLKV